METSNGFGALVEALAPNADVAVVYVDASGFIRSWNAGAEAMFGHSPEAAVGRRADLVVPADQREAHWRGFDRAVRSAWRGSAAWDETEALHRDGGLRPLEVLLVPVRETPERLRGVLAFFRLRKPVSGA